MVFLTICPLYFVVQLDYLSILSLVELLMNKIEICLSYFVELFKNWCKGSAGWTPVSWEVKGDDLLVGQGVLGLDLGAVKSKKFGAAKKLHDSIEGDCCGLKWIQWKFETRMKLISMIQEAPRDGIALEQALYDYNNFMITLYKLYFPFNESQL